MYGEQHPAVTPKLVARYSFGHEASVWLVGLVLVPPAPRILVMPLAFRPAKCGCVPGAAQQGFKGQQPLQRVDEGRPAPLDVALKHA
eukprot:5907401-Alexandrium_andersonii.AAC.1